MKAVRQLQEAKNHLSELVERAIPYGAHTATRVGQPGAVVLGADACKLLQLRKSVVKVLRRN